ncbi:MAG: enoyl-CoA hydratase/isomerase family protein [Gammaproteobacteria bacterium]|nr:enoyl-CoA hydratase/isomerase family protein [Gammaproteobacteria bacterium]MBT4491999.1 enoyl-CoA hydratase/isomerase family protein [Gammaproteobacteria bacterium]
MTKEWHEKYHDIRFEEKDHGILLMTLDRPESLNATDARMHNALSRLWLDIDDDPDVRVVVVTGAGDAFSAGGDLNWIETMVNDYDGMKAALREAGDIVYRMSQCPKIIISAINGTAVGAGLAIALMADISIMAEEAKITDGHVRLGVAAGDHANIVWPLLCGLAKAKYYLLTAEFIDGKTADQIGLVSKAVPRDQLMEEAMKVATKIATGPQDAARWTKRALNLWVTQAAPAFDASLALEMLSFMGPDPKEGVAALKEKRRPNFD